MDLLASRAMLDQAIADLCHDFNSGVCVPLLEADVAAYLFHRLVTNGCPACDVHLATRVCGESARSRKPDLVIGALNTTAACVRAELICEIKAFQRWGLTDQQMRRRFQGVLEEDVPTLIEMTPYCPLNRVELLADFFVSPQRSGYLTGTWEGSARIDVAAAACSRSGAALIWLRPDNVGKMSAVRVVEYPAAPV